MKNGNGEPVARNIIAQGTTIQGDIISSGDLRIEGSINGTIKVKGKVVIGETGNLEGQVHCQSADISGNAKIKLDASELTTLRATSKFSGDIITKKISIEPGAIFSGTCKMGSPESAAIPQHLKTDVKPKAIK